MNLLAPLQDALSLPQAPWLLGAAYLAGSIPFGLLIARFFGKTDVRTQGSGNIGATNVARVVGKKLGALTLALDALKGALPVLAVSLFAIPDESRPALEALVGLSAFLGHCFPIWLKLKGGKGVATGAGFLVAFDPLAGAIGLGAFALTYAVSRYVSLGSLVAALTVIVALVALRPLDAALLPLGLMFLILIFKHRSNITRIVRKEELKV